MLKCLTVLLLLFSFCLNGCGYRKKTSHLPPPSVVSEERIVDVEIRCRTFNNSNRTMRVKVLDVIAPSVRKIFKKLYRRQFPIYAVGCYVNRNIVGSSEVSLHAYGAAIDVNDYHNPFYNALRGSYSIIPTRSLDRFKDQESISKALAKAEVNDLQEVQAILEATIQPQDSDDWFINRELNRPGMLTAKEAKIFSDHGFTIWGGRWRQPIDFMHFQVPKKLAQKLVSVDKKEGRDIWIRHVSISRCNNVLAEKLTQLKNKAKREDIWSWHLHLCKDDDGYLSAVSDKNSAAICLRDCIKKLSYIEK